MTETTPSSTTEEFVLITDPVTSVPVQVPKSLELFIGHLIGFNRKAGKEPVENENKELKDQLDKLQVQLNDMATTNKDNKTKPTEEFEQFKTEMQGVIEELNKKNELSENQLTQWKTRHDEQRKINDIQGVLGTFDLHNRSQVVDILQSQAKLKEDIDLGTGEKKGTYTTVLTLNLPDESGVVRPVELPASKAVESFLSMEENQFHLKNKLNPGAGSFHSGLNNNSDATKYDKAFNEAAEQNNTLGQVAAMQDYYNDVQKPKQ